MFKYPIQLTFAAAAAAAKFKYPHRLARRQCGGRPRQPSQLDDFLFAADGNTTLSACLTFPSVPSVPLYTPRVVKVVSVVRPCYAHAVLTCPDATRTAAGTVAQGPHPS